MSWLIGKTKKSFEDPMAISETIMALAKAEEQKLLDKSEEMLAEAIKEHEFDSRHYDFEARRWGDFLQIGIKRWGKTWEAGKVYKGIQSAALTLNLMETCDFAYYEGKPPGNKQHVIYRAFRNSESVSSPYYVKVEFPDKYNTDPRNMYWRRPPADGKSYYSIGSGGGGSGGGGYYYTNELSRPELETQVPCMAEDDCITFERIGVTIYAPYGKGLMVRDRIHEALQEGAGWRSVRS